MTAAESAPAKAIGQRELVVLIALLMSLNALAIDAMLPALDEIAHEFDVAAGNERQLIISVYLLANGIGALVPGSFADRFGRKPVIMIALASYAVFSIANALVTDFMPMLWARGLQGLLCGGLMVAPIALVRDRYEGDKMARTMSLVSAVFIIMPVIAPSLGQAVMLFAGWRWIFVVLAVLSAFAALWTWFRLPETLTEANRQTIDLPVIVGNMKIALFTRASLGYVLGTALLIGSVFGYVNSAQQLIGEHFGAGDWFPIVFGGTAAMMAVSNIVNSRIVTRFGARRVSHAGVLMFIVVSSVQVWASIYREGQIEWFVPLMATNLALLGFLGANFGSIAMQPFAQIAGAASSVQTFFRMFGAACVGLVIGQAYDGTAHPFAIALLTCSILALVFVLYSEKGKLFRRLNQPHRPHIP